MYIVETGVAARCNQSFFRNGWGGEVGLLFSFTSSLFPDIELQYARVNGHFDHSGYDLIKQYPVTSGEDIHTQLDYLKLPLVYTFGHWSGPNFSPYIETGLAPSFLLQVKNGHDLLGIEDMNRLNCSYTFGGGIHLLTNMRLGLRFSGDIFNNLEDENVYNTAGIKVGKQNSRNYLISLSLAYRLKRHYLYGKQQ